MLQAADLDEDLLSGDIVTADGRSNLADAITEFEHGETEARLLDILCCEGCIMGAGFSCEEPVFKRRSDVSRETRLRRAAFDQAAWEAAVAEFADVDLSRTFAPFDQRFDDMPTPEELREILARMNKSSAEDELDCGACGYESCRDHAVAIWQGLAEVEMCLPYAVEELRKTVDELQESNRSLETTKEALVKSEKLASMGQLAAGIAHEVNNPLGILLLHANLLLEDCEDDTAVADDVKLIVDQANRCKKIISGLLNFARQSRVVRQPTDLAALVQEVLRTIPVDEGVDDHRRRPPRRPDRRARRRPDRAGAHQPAHQRPARAARRRARRSSRSTAPRRTSSSWSPTTAPASPTSTSTSSSARSSPPSRWARAPASASP